MAPIPEVKLLGTRFSPFVHRVEWALKLRGVEYEYQEEDLFDKSALLLKCNPINKEVPVLLHEGRPVVESQVIIEYIDKTWKHSPPIMPKDPYDRAMARIWARHIDTKFGDAIKKAFFTQGEEQQKAVELAVKALEPLEEELRGKKFFGGEKIGFVDLVAGWIAHWIGVVEEVASIKVVDPKKFPSLAAWMEEFVEVPVIKENLPPKDQMPGFYRKLRSRFLQ